MRLAPPSIPDPVDPTRPAPWASDVLCAPFWALWEGSMVAAGWEPGPGGAFGPPPDVRPDGPDTS